MHIWPYKFKIRVLKALKILLLFTYRRDENMYWICSLTNNKYCFSTYIYFFIFNTELMIEILMSKSLPIKRNYSRKCKMSFGNDMCAPF